MTGKKYLKSDVLTEARKRIKIVFDHFERVYVSFSAGKDSTVLLHLLAEEAIKRGRRLGVLLVDLEGQYGLTMEHARACLEMYKDHIEVYWICLPLSLRNAVSNFQPQWTCWDPAAKDLWIRPLPQEAISDPGYFPFFQPGMEFEEFVPLFGEWYAQGKSCACFVGIRTDESFNRFRTITSRTKATFQGHTYTTRVSENLYNVYPIYDWSVQDIWLFHYKNPALPYNQIIVKPDGHTWKSYCELLLASLPEATRDHYLKKFKVFLTWWEKHGYPDGIPDEADGEEEAKKRAPSYRRLCKAILRNDYWCRGLSFSPPKSKAYEKFLEISKRESRLDRQEKKTSRQ